MLSAWIIAYAVVVLSRFDSEGTTPLVGAWIILAVGVGLGAWTVVSPWTPNAPPIALAIEGRKLWYRQEARRWVGPIDLRHTTGVAAQLGGRSSRTVNGRVPFCLLVVHDDLVLRGSLAPFPKKVRQWVGDRGRLTVEDYQTRSGDLPKDSVVLQILQMVPLNTPIAPESVSLIRLVRYDHPHL